jgi:hypothetical protein
LLSALDKISGAVGTGLAAMVSEGWYMVGTPEWWMMTPQETLIIQHITTHVPEVGYLETGDSSCLAVHKNVWH